MQVPKHLVEEDLREALRALREDVRDCQIGVTCPVHGEVFQRIDAGQLLLSIYFPGPIA